MILNRQSGFGVGPTINPCTKVSLSDCRDYGYGRSPYPGSLQKEKTLMS